MTLRIGILAGEPSGDRLGAGLMEALRAEQPDVAFRGVGGPLMEAAGLEALASMDVLGVNGFVEPVLRLPQLLKVYGRLLAACGPDQLDAFIGVDFNVFNLLLERQLRRRGQATAHYVSPSVYAWRPGRVRRVARAAELLLTLFPFEAASYRSQALRVAYVGHPLADELPAGAGSEAARAEARAALGLPKAGVCIALLPGSRRSEIRLMLPGFLEAAVKLARALPGAQFLIPCVSAELAAEVESQRAGFAELDLKVDVGDARRALTACDGAIVKSGTGTLEAMLLERPMVVSYRLGELSYRLVRRLLKTPYVALPNILAGRALVPELLQHDATPAALAQALLTELDSDNRSLTRQRFRELGDTLRCGADGRAARAVLDWLEERA